MTDLASLIEKTPLETIWKRIGAGSHHGVAISLLGLISTNSGGVGEFGDLCILGDLCKKWGLDTIQVLPLNDSGPDPSPYNALSSIALHPIYLSLRSLPAWEAPLKELVCLGAEKYVPYTKILALKERLLRQYFERYFTGYKEMADYQTFTKNNPWVWEYALFKALKKVHGGKMWSDWPEPLKNIDEISAGEQAEIHAQEITFHVFVQYLCFKQLTATKRYLSSIGIRLMGDLPILVSPDSADVWIHRQFFDLTYSAGAPPDVFNSEGQYWGSPPYHWEAMEANNFIWWKRRLAFATPFYDIYRIDHVVGLFHLWVIPRGKTPKEGHYTPPFHQNHVKGEHKLLEMFINESPMLPIAEDLGTIPKGLFHSLQTLGIPGTRVIRWERRWETDKSYIPYNEYNPINMISVSTHDSEMLEEWWRKHPDEAQAFAAFKGWTYTPGAPMKREELYAILKDSHTIRAAFHINPLQEHLRFFPELSWGTPEEERINIPGFVLPTNWVYRYKPMLDILGEHKELAAHFRSLTT